MKRKIMSAFYFIIISIQLVAAQVTVSDADAVFINVEKTYTLQVDGSMRFDYAHRLKLQTAAAVNRYFGETFIVYHPEYQKLTVDKSTTTMLDGTQVPSPQNAFNEGLPFSVARAPAYAHLREMIVTHTGLERGAIVDLRYHIDSKADFVPWLFGEEVFAATSPIQSMQVNVIVPTSVKLNYEFLNDTLPPQVSEESGALRYSWMMENISGMRSEPNHVDFREISPRLVFSTCPDWKQIAEYLQTQIDHQLSDWTRSSLSVEPGGNRLSQALDIRRRVSEEIATVTLEPNHIGWRLAKSEDTFRRNYGTVFDKALLLTSVLLDAGYKAKIALVPSPGNIAMAVPSLSSFQSACVVLDDVADSPLVLFLDQGQHRMAQDVWPGKALLLLKSEGHEWLDLPASGSAENRLTVDANLKLDDQGNVAGNAVVSASGYPYPYFDLLSNDAQKKWLNSVLDPLFGKVTILKSTPVRMMLRQGEFVIEFQRTDFLKAIPDAGLLNFSGLESVFSRWSVSTVLTKRFLPLQLPASLQETIELTISLPPDLKLVSLPQHFSMNDSGYQFDLRLVQNERDVQLYRSFIIPDRAVSPLEYPEFRKMVALLNSKNLNTLIFKK